MKAIYVDFESVEAGIDIDTEKYPHITLGDGGNKRATWVGLGSRDANSIIVDGRVYDVGVIRTRKGGYLIVAPRGEDNRALVFWSLPSGYRGGANIDAPDDVTVIASDKRWHSGRGAIGEDAEVLAILRPGDELRGSRTGRRVQFRDWVLRYDGTRVTVDPAVATEAEVEYSEDDYV